MKLRICTIILLLSISLISCTNVKRKNEKMVNIEAENHYDTTFQKNLSPRFKKRRNSVNDL